MNLTIPLVLLAIGQSMGLACSCLAVVPCRTVSRDLAAFVGKAIRTRSTWSGMVAVDFVVSEGFGNLTGKTKLTVYTNAQSTACGYPFQMGVEYFVSTSGAVWDLRTSSCSLTRPVIVAASFIRQVRAIQAGKAPAALFGFIGVEPYPGVSPGSRVEAKPAASIPVTAVGPAGVFQTTTAADGSFEFIGLPQSTYHLRIRLPKDMFIWWASDTLSRAYAVSPEKMCEADFPLYPKDDPFAGTQTR